VVSEDVVPPTINYTARIRSVNLDYVPNEARRMVCATRSTTLSVSAARTAALVLKKYEG